MMRLDKLINDRPSNPKKKITGIVFKTPAGIHLKGGINRSFESKPEYQDYLKEHGCTCHRSTDSPSFLKPEHNKLKATKEWNPKSVEIDIIKEY